MVRVVVVGLSIAFFVSVWAQSVDKELEEKRKELEKKAVEILDLRSALIIQQAELEQLRAELERLKSQNQLLCDSLKGKEAEIRNLKELIRAIREDKKLSRAILENIKFSPGSDTGEAVREISAQEYSSIYSEALSLYFAKEYKSSIEKFRYLVSVDRTHPLADNAQYWLGECYYSMERYDEAISAFEAVPDLGDGNKTDAALFKIALGYLKLGDRKKAEETFRKLRMVCPESKLIERAKEYLNLGKSFRE